ncbi:MAG: hypothetical protein ACYC49_09330 [Ignavibacteriaceae bacterium]
MKDNIQIKLFQTCYRRLPGRTDFYVLKHHLKVGAIYFDKKVFLSVERNPKNLFRLFRDPGLGINAEILEIILPRFGVERIQIPYLGKILETTASKWRALGMQIILSLTQINLDNAAKYVVKEAEPSLFAEVI